MLLNLEPVFQKDMALVCIYVCVLILVGVLCLSHGGCVCVCLKEWHNGLSILVYLYEECWQLNAEY